MTRVRDLYLIQDTERSLRAGPRFYWSLTKPAEDSPQKLVAVVEMNIRRMTLDAPSPEVIWNIILEMS